MLLSTRDATVYYQFGSKSGLLEALCDDLAASGQMGDLAKVFTTPDPLDALHAFVAAKGSGPSSHASPSTPELSPRAEIPRRSSTCCTP